MVGMIVPILQMSTLRPRDGEPLSCVCMAGKWGMGLSLGSQALAPLTSSFQCQLPSTCESRTHPSTPCVSAHALPWGWLGTVRPGKESSRT